MPSWPRALAAFVGAPLVHDAHTMARIDALFARRGRPMPARNRVQALVPTGFEALDNHHGTAPGLLLARDGRFLVVLPGVPREMQELLGGQALPRIEAARAAAGQAARVIRHRTILTAGIGESALADLVGDLAP